MLNMLNKEMLNGWSDITRVNGINNTYFFHFSLPADCIPELSVEARLTNYLLRRYRQVGRIARPVHNATSSVDVEFGLGLIQVLDFDETNQVLTTSVWKRFVSLLAKSQHF